MVVVNLLDVDVEEVLKEVLKVNEVEVEVKRKNLVPDHVLDHVLDHVREVNNELLVGLPPEVLQKNEQQKNDLQNMT
jgi:hypothetical protein